MRNILWVGCGKLGRHCCARLRDAGLQVTATRRSEAALAELPAGVEGAVLDLDHLVPREPLLGRPWDAVVVTLSAAPNPAAYRRAYVDGTRALLAALENNGSAPLVLFASSTSVYAQNDGSIVDERSPADSTGFSGVCMREAEGVLADASLPTSSIRFSGIYGGGRDNHLLRLLNEGRICPQQPVHFSNRIHSDDCAGIFQHLLGRAARGEPVQPLYLGCDGNPAPLREVMEWLAAREGIATQELIEDYQPNRGGNRRCMPARLLAEGWQPRYSDYRAGFAAAAAPG